MNIRLERWMRDPVKAKRLKDIVLDPIFIEAVDVLLNQTRPVVKMGESALQENALQAAYQAGLSDAFIKLELLTEFTEENLQEEKKKTNQRVIPWQHIEQEQSSFV
jgi:hypothetical protein